MVLDRRRATCSRVNRRRFAGCRPDIRPARPEDCETLHALVVGLAEYERLAHAVVGSVEDLRAELFAAAPVIEAALAWEGGRAVGFALWFHTYSTFLARRGLWLEDLFVVPEARGKGYGKALLKHCAKVAIERGCGRFEWSVLNWNEPSIISTRLPARC
jgi:GNAT superfamily N-acetyltransferase